MPEKESITYQGVFNEHLYDVGYPESHHLVKAEGFPFVHGGDPWVAIWLKSVMDGKPRNETPIDLSVVIDISGSMSGGMSRIDGSSSNRLEHSILAVEWLVKEVLRPEDRIAVSTFNTTGHLVQDFTSMDSILPDPEELAPTKQEAFLAPVRALRTNGGTTLAAGMEIGRRLLGEKPETHRHRRILFLTDMGEMRADDLDEMIKKNADEGVYVSIVAMGAEFNASLTETVTKNKGSNYFCATDESQLRECIVDDFDFNYFPSAFEINLSVRSAHLKVASVYGTPFDTKDVEELLVRWSPETHNQYDTLSRCAAKSLLFYSHAMKNLLPKEMIGHVMDLLEPPKCTVTEVNTMFPSRLEAGNAMKGGLIMLKMKPLSTTEGLEAALELALDYEDPAGAKFSQTDMLLMPGVKEGGPQREPHIQRSLDKAMLLQRYAEVCRTNIDGPFTDEALAELTKEVEEFTSSVEAGFGEDKKMKGVVETYKEFMEVFNKKCPRHDTQKAPSPP